MNNLFYNNRRIDPTTFRLGRKDISKLKGFCRYCGKEIEGEEAMPRPDPFASEVRGDDTLIVQCGDCYHQSCQDI